MCSCRYGKHKSRVHLYCYSWPGCIYAPCRTLWTVLKLNGMLRVSPNTRSFGSKASASWSMYRGHCSKLWSLPWGTLQETPRRWLICWLLRSLFLQLYLCIVSMSWRWSARLSRRCWCAWAEEDSPLTFCLMLSAFFMRNIVSFQKVSLQKWNASRNGAKGWGLHSNDWILPLICRIKIFELCTWASDFSLGDSCIPLVVSALLLESRLAFAT